MWQMIFENRVENVKGVHERFTQCTTIINTLQIFKGKLLGYHTFRSRDAFTCVTSVLHRLTV